MEIKVPFHEVCFLCALMGPVLSELRINNTQPSFWVDLVLMLDKVATIKTQYSELTLCQVWGELRFIKTKK